MVLSFAVSIAKEKENNEETARRKKRFRRIVTWQLKLELVDLEELEEL